MEYLSGKLRAEKLYGEKSYALAHEIYQSLKEDRIPQDEKRWVAFRLADTLCRAKDGSTQSDRTDSEEALQKLEEIYQSAHEANERDEVWAHAAESLGDYYWISQQAGPNWSQALPYYQAALDFWSAFRDVDVARKRYIAIVQSMSFGPSAHNTDYYYGCRGYVIPLDILENYKKIAANPSDKACASYLLACGLSRGGYDRLLEARSEFEEALEIAKKTEWYDDALYQYAQFLEQRGKVVEQENGQPPRFEADFKRALEIYRRIVAEFGRDGRYSERAMDRIDSITEQSLTIGVSSVFLPDSFISYTLQWHNLSKVDLSLYQIDLLRDVRLHSKDSTGDWINKINLGQAELLSTWSFDTEDRGDYRPGSKNLELKDKLPVGAYLLVGKSNGKTARQLLLVSDATLVVKTSGRQELAYLCDINTGAPLKETNLTLWYSDYKNNQNEWNKLEAKADTRGLALFTLPGGISTSSSNLLLLAKSGDKQAFCTAFSCIPGGVQQGWKIYVVTDKPAYRPKETMHWKATVRLRRDQEYSTPSGYPLFYTIRDARGAELKKDKCTLNSFGACWGSLELGETLPLGEYHIEFRRELDGATIGSATLFRLEEYKLPEYKVSVQTPEEDGKKKTFWVGDTVEATVQAEYYFGGAVSNAQVELLVYQKPYYHYPIFAREYGWLYRDIDRPPYVFYGDGNIIKREMLRTDSDGKATIRFDTPRHQRGDFEYTIEARVMDSSRREIRGTGAVRVTRQSYYVTAEPEGRVYKPQSQVRVDFKAEDANRQPQQVEGEVKVVRQSWKEIWISPEGEEVSGPQLRTMQRTCGFFPPPMDPGKPGWKLKSRGYEREDMLNERVKTDAEGKGEFAFTPSKEGYYSIEWSSKDSGKKPIQASTAVWVSTEKTSDVGYYTGGLQILLGRETLHVGEKAPVMLACPASGRYVLFGVAPDDLSTYQLIEMEGTSKLLEISIEPRHVPNIFFEAAMVAGRSLWSDAKQAVVPPEEHFIKVDLASDQKEYLPRQKGKYTLTTLDSKGKPVSAEVSLGVIDEALFYIQTDYAGDPRQFFFGQKRGNANQLQSTLSQRNYQRLVHWKEGLVDERQLASMAEDEERAAASRAFRGRDISGMECEDRDMSCETRPVMGLGGAVVPEVYKSMPAGSTTVDAPNAPPLDGGISSRFGDTARNTSLRREAGKGSFKSELQETPTPESEVVVRSAFRSSIFWQPDLKTDASGKASIEVTYPDSTTTWKATARAATQGQQFGIGEASAQTRQPIIARLQGPRFFVVGDEVVLSGVINNNTSQKVSVEPQLEVKGLKLIGSMQGGKKSSRMPSSLSIQPGSSARADWVVQVEHPGEARVKLIARSAKASDAMELTYPVYEHGIEKFVRHTAKLLNGGETTLQITLPKERKKNSTSLEVQVAPSIAVTMLDALPYLIDYPYGCTEQTMSRFLPAVVVSRALEKLGLEPNEIAGRAFGGIEEKHVASTHPKEKKNLTKLTQVIDQSLARLYDFQKSNGGWGWWKDRSEEADLFMSAYVVWGLALAKQNGVSVREDVLRRGVDFLDSKLLSLEERPDDQAWVLHALANARLANVFIENGKTRSAMDDLFKRRDKLNAYTRALVAYSFSAFGDQEKAHILRDNLYNGVCLDGDTVKYMRSASNGSKEQLAPGQTMESLRTSATAHWGEDGIHYRWSEGGVEATAFALRALLAIDPKDKLIEPVMNWMVANRRGAQWSNTRSTAISILALTDYMQKSGELAADGSYELWVNGKKRSEGKISPKDVLCAPSRFKIDREWLKDGENSIRLVQKGKGALYLSAEATYFSLEKPIPAEGSQIFVRREYFKKVGRPTLLKGYVYDTVPLLDKEEIKSGERVEVVLTIESKNELEYLVFEDLKPAGFEAVQIRSGEDKYARELSRKAFESGSQASSREAVGTTTVEPAAEGSREAAAGGAVLSRRVSSLQPMGFFPRPGPASEKDSRYTGRTRWMHQELRDRKVAFFIDKLPQGVWEIRYELIAEVPGQFAALPTLGHAMYVPEIRCNGQEIEVNVLDAD